MTDGLEARARAAAEAGVARTVERLAERAEAVPGVSVEAEAGRVVLTGRGLWRMAELRWIGGLLR